MRYRIGYYCPRGEGHWELFSNPDFEATCGSRGWYAYLDCDPDDEDLPDGEWVL